MSSLYDELAEITCRYLSTVNAHAILKQVVTESDRTAATLTNADLPGLVSKLERAVMLFLDASKRRALRAEVDKLAARAGPAEPKVQRRQRVEIRTEQDITEARLIVRQLCQDLGARSLQCQKVATVVSELARNIVSYTKGGYLELVAETTGPKAIVIRAADEGPGIRNLDEILSGKYRSSTGLGLGIVGTKRLADRFDIQSDARGTRIEVSVRL
jgi:serine/threonine-protein kinase RsbT